MMTRRAAIEPLRVCRNDYSSDVFFVYSVVIISILPMCMINFQELKTLF